MSHSLVKNTFYKQTVFYSACSTNKEEHFSWVLPFPFFQAVDGTRFDFSNSTTASLN